GQQQTGSLARKGQGRGRANAGAGPRNEGDLSLQSHPGSYLTGRLLFRAILYWPAAQSSWAIPATRASRKTSAIKSARLSRVSRLAAASRSKRKSFSPSAMVAPGRSG